LASADNSEPLAEDSYRGILAAVRNEAAQHGLLVRGAFAPEQADGVPALACGTAARALVLFGNAGSSLWPAFSRSPEFGDGAPDPLDRWSRRIAQSLAERFGAMALFPFGGPPHAPFYRWARKAEALHASAVGMLIHPQYGLWHAYRFALAFAQPLADVASPQGAGSPCERCSAKPCLSACPAGAFNAGSYDVQRCVGYLQSAPEAACWTGGCRVRHACPEGKAYRYLPAQAEFHMRAFVARQLEVTPRPRPMEMDWPRRE
jgi:hypothetical protein